MKDGRHRLMNPVRYGAVAPLTPTPHLIKVERRLRIFSDSRFVASKIGWNKFVLVRRVKSATTRDESRVAIFPRFRSSAISQIERTNRVYIAPNATIGIVPRCGL